MKKDKKIKKKQKTTHLCSKKYVILYQIKMKISIKTYEKASIYCRTLL